MPGSRLFIVTPLAAIPPRARPAANPVGPLRAPFGKPRMWMGGFSAVDVMLTILPKPRAAMPSTVCVNNSNQGHIPLFIPG